MNPKKRLDVEKLLSSYPAPEPPEDLARRIHEEIPPLETVPVAAPPARPRGWMKAAAVLALMAGAAYAAYRLTWNRKFEPRREAVRNLPTSAPAPAISPVPVEHVAVLPSPRPRLHPAQRPAATPVLSAMVENQVVDQSGAPLPGVTVTLNGAGASRTAVTDAYGVARFPSIQGGQYQMETSLAGFGKIEQVIHIASGETKQARSALQLSTTAEVTVVGSTPLVDVTSTSQGSNYAATPAGAYRFTRSLQNDPNAVQPVPSTGGSREPNAQPYGDVFFKAYGTNPFVDTEEDPLSTFGLDVDTGSYGIARRYLSDGNLPPSEAIRVEEFVNAFDYGDAPPRRGDFAIRAVAAPSPYPRASDLYRVVRFGIRARDIDPRDRKPATLVFVVDVSGSMQQENRLGLVKQALGLLIDRLRSSDRVGLVIFGSTAQAVLDPTSDHARIRQAIGQLAAGGSTNAEAGLRVGYEMAGRNRRDDGINRVILCSDGVANEGLTGADGIIGTIEREAKGGGIELTTVGFGMGNYNDVLMEQLADKGNGRYIYVDTLREAQRAFVENLTGTLQTIGSDARVQVEFDPSVVSRYRLLGYENRDIADEKFRDDKVDAGEIGAGHTVTAVYEIRLASRSVSGTAATLRLRYRSAETKQFVETEEKIRVRDFDDRFDRAPRDLRLASLVAELAEVLKKSYWARGVDAAALSREIRGLRRDWPGDDRVSELADLSDRASALLAREPSGDAPED